MSLSVDRQQTSNFAADNDMTRCVYEVCSSFNNSYDDIARKLIIKCIDQ